MKQRIFSGIQPSGNLHIGNYLGAVLQWVEMQEKYEAFFCIMDLHAITMPQDPKELRERTLEIVKIYLAAGIDPKKAALFVQSHVREHAELGWILTTLARMGELERMTQYKDKSQKGGASSSGVGLFAYPALMAADIVLYDTVAVPVGKDQMQHVELARDLAERFNKRFGDTFVVPQGKLSKEGALIMALDNPAKKMSKSATSEYNYIALMDDPELAKKKIMKAVTDSGTEILYSDDPPTGEAGKPALKNLINIFSLVGYTSVEEVVKKFRGRGYADFKKALADMVANFLTDFQQKFHAISDEEALRILHDGAEKARVIASEKMKTVREKVGFLA